MSFDPLNSPHVTAVLGPTNTGKTHFAIERMLGHASGMIGLPLRLLAREIYDRVVAQKGAKAVALITGEEKIVPASARYFVCTVEAMPLDRPNVQRVDCLVIDEIQLASHPERGHVFTDRLLHARGLSETIFLGAETMKQLIAALVPEVEIITRPRLSQLAYSGYKKPARLPPRTAIVAFSATEVYRIAEFIRQHRGGTAVVLGALSPRARNAQVDLFERGEVDYLVATDAIGMGLNLDIAHVAFARDCKFDGRSGRRLWPEEIAQIAGRAGRHMRDGTFGTTFELKEFSEELVEKIERHRFDPVTRLYWRNSRLDFTTPRALIASLEERPGNRVFAQMHDGDDHRTLKALSERLETGRKTIGRAGTRLLWDVCQIPDFRRIMSDDHINLLAQIFDHLSSRPHKLPTDWIAREIARLDQTIGTIETLSAGLAAIRTWTYVTAKSSWTDHGDELHALARATENHISDALHAALSERFVDRRSASLARASSTGQELLAGVRDNGEVVVEGHAMGMLKGFAFVPDETILAGDRQMVLKTALRALGQEIKMRVSDFAAQPAAAFTLELDGSIAWLGDAVARLAPGARLLEPAIQILKSDLLDASQEARIAERLSLWLRSEMRRRLQTLFGLARAQTDDALDPELRGIAFRLFENHGIIEADHHDFTKAQMQWLQSRGVTIGARYLYMKGLLKPELAAFLALLWNVQHHTKLAPPKPSRITTRIAAAEDELFYAAIGYPAIGQFAIRVDRLDALAGEMQSGNAVKSKTVAKQLYCKQAEAEAIMAALAHAPKAKVVKDFAQTPFAALKFATLVK